MKPASTAGNVQNTPTMDKAMHDNASNVRAGAFDTDEKIGFLNGDKNGNLTFRSPDDATTGHSSAEDNAKAGIQPGDVAVLHGHTPNESGLQDNTNHGRSLGDAQPLTKGLTNGTVKGDRLGVHELVNGRVQFRMIDGKMLPAEEADFQKNLDDQQEILNQPP